MAAPTTYYVDYGAGNDTTGNGTIGTPWKTIQKALDTITRDATNGDQVNIKAGTAQVLAASLSLTTYGAPAETAPLVLRGYTSTAGDGGQGEIDCGGNPMFASARSYMILADLEMHNFGNNHGVDLSGGYCLTYRCEFHKGASSPSSKYLLASTTTNLHIGCWFHDAGAGNGQAVNGGKLYYGCYFYNCTYAVVLAQNIINNIFVDCANSIWGSVDLTVVIGNSLYSSTANTASAILAGTANTMNWALVLNNIIEGWSGTGGKAIASSGDTALLGYNAYYNNTANESMADIWLDLGGDQVLSASPFNNPAGGDFSIKTTSAAIEAAWQSAWFGPASTTGKPDMGAVQAGAGSGSGMVSISPHRGNIG